MEKQHFHGFIRGLPGALIALIGACSPAPEVRGTSGTIHGDGAATAYAADAGEAGAWTPRRFTKQEFAQHVQGKTKADIRREFGPPLVVHDDSDSWYYSKLPIYDADAGIQVSVTIRFMGLTPAEADEVLEVSY